MEIVCFVTVFYNKKQLIVCFHLYSFTYILPVINCLSLVKTLKWWTDLVSISGAENFCSSCSPKVFRGGADEQESLCWAFLLEEFQRGDGDHGRLWHCAEVCESNDPLSVWLTGHLLFFCVKSRLEPTMTWTAHHLIQVSAFSVVVAFTPSNIGSGYMQILASLAEAEAWREATFVK